MCRICKIFDLKHHLTFQDEVKKNLTIKRDKKKELAQRKLLESERAATAALVEKHSQEMMLLITEKRANYLETEANGDAQHVASDYPSQPPPPGPPAFAKIGKTGCSLDILSLFMWSM